MSIDVFDGHQLIGVIRQRSTHLWEAFEPDGTHIRTTGSEQRARWLIKNRARTLRRIEIMQGHRR